MHHPCRLNPWEDDQDCKLYFQHSLTLYTSMANYKMQEYINRLEYPIEHKYAAQKRLFSHIKANTDPREQDT